MASEVRAEVLAERAHVAAGRVAVAAERIMLVQGASHPRGVVVSRQAWFLLQAEVQAWRVATKRVAEALEG